MLTERFALQDAFYSEWFLSRFTPAPTARAASSQNFGRRIFRSCHYETRKRYRFRVLFRSHHISGEIKVVSGPEPMIGREKGPSRMLKSRVREPALA